MCGRLYRDQDPDDDPGESWTRIGFDGETIDKMQQTHDALTQPNYNVTPGTVQPVILQGKQGMRCLPLQWGLVGRHGEPATPSNARSETIFEKPMFRHLIGCRRCIVPTNGYFEWQGKQPYYFRAANGRRFALAGIYDTTHTLDGAVGSYAIVTTSANPEISAIHERMPVILPDRAACEAWLSFAVRDRAQIAALLQPYPAERMQWWPVSKRINSTKNNDPSLIARVAAGDPGPVQPALFG